jgi:hypothetical protein
MSDLVQRLRGWLAGEVTQQSSSLLREAADRIEALEAELAATRELMNVYNLGGWTDALGPMQRALKAEAELRGAWHGAKFKVTKHADGSESHEMIDPGVWRPEGASQDTPQG